MMDYYLPHFLAVKNPELPLGFKNNSCEKTLSRGNFRIQAIYQSYRQAF